MRGSRPVSTNFAGEPHLDADYQPAKVCEKQRVAASGDGENRVERLIVLRELLS
jgi:hypothetical protein